ncbi:hypothetical protein CEUSTIGMA_g12250.t1 [Chlamydomonas eustigma]|uniref:RAP domain-containing protein n=1 Tax=Chlamydomonas eustigma TaxID=1157962 RepID=A0A250XPF4_9CHLO|nr:hypothetical protein CEUSTIGMA_g12250.t1 [Chlamydomonas eustigma]|eukprot:GAX84829.1 hypothetical protein CEUSTIGMA_g12250.t1 [Chlamydomonas eustigma]
MKLQSITYHSAPAGTSLCRFSAAHYVRWIALGGLSKKKPSKNETGDEAAYVCKELVCRAHALHASERQANPHDEEDAEQDIWPSSQSQSNVARLVSLIFNPSASVSRLSVHVKSLPTKDLIAALLTAQRQLRSADALTLEPLQRHLKLALSELNKRADLSLHVRTASTMITLLKLAQLISSAPLGEAGEQYTLAQHHILEHTLNIVSVQTMKRDDLSAVLGCVVTNLQVRGSRHQPSLSEVLGVIQAVTRCLKAEVAAKTGDAVAESGSRNVNMMGGPGPVGRGGPNTSAAAAASRQSRGAEISSECAAPVSAYRTDLISLERHRSAWSDILNATFLIIEQYTLPRLLSTDCDNADISSAGEGVLGTSNTAIAQNGDEEDDDGLSFHPSAMVFRMQELVASAVGIAPELGAMAVTALLKSCVILRASIPYNLAQAVLTEAYEDVDPCQWSHPLAILLVHLRGDCYPSSHRPGPSNNKVYGEDDTDNTYGYQDATTAATHSTHYVSSQVASSWIFQLMREKEGALLRTLLKKKKMDTTSSILTIPTDTARHYPSAGSSSVVISGASQQDSFLEHVLQQLEIARLLPADIESFADGNSTRSFDEMESDDTSSLVAASYSSSSTNSTSKRYQEGGSLMPLFCHELLLWNDNQVEKEGGEGLDLEDLAALYRCQVEAALDDEGTLLSEELLLKTPVQHWSPTACGNVAVALYIHKSRNALSVAVSATNSDDSSDTSFTLHDGSDNKTADETQRMLLKQVEGKLVENGASALQQISYRLLANLYLISSAASSHVDGGSVELKGLVQPLCIKALATRACSQALVLHPATDYYSPKTEAVDYSSKTEAADYSSDTEAPDYSSDTEAADYSPKTEVADYSSTTAAGTASRLDTASIDVTTTGQMGQICDDIVTHPFSSCYYSMALNKEILSSLSSGRLLSYSAVAMVENCAGVLLGGPISSDNNGYHRESFHQENDETTEISMWHDYDGSYGILLLLTTTLQFIPYLLSPRDAVQLLSALACNKHQLQQALRSLGSPIGSGGPTESAAESKMHRTSSLTGEANLFVTDVPDLAIKKQVQQLYPRVLSRLSLHITENVKSFKMDQLVSVLENLSVLGWRPGILLSSICQQLIGVVSSVEVVPLQDEENRRRSLVMASMQSALLSLARLRYSKGPAIAIATWCLKHGRQYGVEPEALAGMVWACGRIKFRKDALLKPVLQSLLGTSDKLPVWCLAHVVWSCATLGYSTERLSDWAVQQLGGGLRLRHDTISAQTLSNLVWGLSRLGCQPSPAFLMEVLMRADALKEDFKGPELSALLSALVCWRKPLMQTKLYTAASEQQSPGNTSLMNIATIVLSRLLGYTEDEVLSGEVLCRRLDVEGAVGCVWALISLGRKPSLVTLRHLSGHIASATTLVGSNKSFGASSTSHSGLFFPEADKQLAPTFKWSHGEVNDAAMCNFLMACYRCHYTPRGLLDVYSADLGCRLLPLRQMPFTSSCNGAHDKQDGPHVVDKMGAALPSSSFGRKMGEVKSLAGSREGIPGPDECASACLALGLHRLHDVGLLQALEQAAIMHMRENKVSPQLLARMLHGFALAGYCPKAWFRQGLPRALRISIHSMSLPQLARVTSALGSWKKYMVAVGQERQAWTNLLNRALLPALGSKLQASSPSPTVAMFLLNGLGSLELSKQTEVTKTVVGWLMQPSCTAPFSSAPTSQPASAADAQSLEGPSTDVVKASSETAVTLKSGLPQQNLPQPPSSSALNPSHTLLSSSQSDRSICSFIWSMGKLKYDSLEALTTCTTILTSRHNLEQHASSMGVADVVRCLWGCAKLNRHPGDPLLAILHRQWRLLTSDLDLDSQGGTGALSQSNVGLQEDLLYVNLCTILYCLAVLKEHTNPLFQLASSQLGRLVSMATSLEPLDPTLVRPGSLGGGASSKVPPVLHKQLDQVAVALLMAQADRISSSPLNIALTPLVKAEALTVWRTKVLNKAQKRPNRYQYEVVSACTRLGWQARLGVVSQDGVVCPDVLVILPAIPAVQFAFELLGSHNTACNSMRVLGDAAIKYRLLQARGYTVIPISCNEWDSLNGDARALSLQQKVDLRVQAAQTVLSASGKIPASEVKVTSIDTTSKFRSPLSQDMSARLIQQNERLKSSRPGGGLTSKGIEAISVIKLIDETIDD